jgi:hypothetical protein
MYHKPIVLTDEDLRIIREIAKDIDLEQAAISRRLTSDQRVRKVLSMSKLVRRMGVQRLLKKHPELTEAEAHRMWLARYYELEARKNGDRRP